MQFVVNPNDLAAIQAMFALSPAIVAKHMRDAFGQFAGSHRKAVLAGATPNYQRLLRKSLFYRVRPKQAVQTSSAFGVADLRRAVPLEAVRARIWATSRVTLLHETGGTVTAKGKRLAIPATGSGDSVRARKLSGAAKKAASPAAMRAAGTKFVRKGSLLFKVDKTTAKGKDRLKLTHLLTGAVHIKPATKIVATWNSLAADRDRRLRRSTNAAAVEMARVGSRKVGAALQGVIRAVS